MKDSIYTSPELADALVSLANLRHRPSVVADFACGEGSLLLAAERRWPDALAVANDVSVQAIARVRKTRPTWELACADFLNPRSVRASRLRRHIGSVDVVTINPPFSRRDKRTYPVGLFEETFSASIATAFVAHSVPFLRTGGILLAVLPDGCLVSLHDRAIWDALKNAFRIEIIRDNAHSAFQGVRARTCLVRMTRVDTKDAASTPGNETSRGLVHVSRGTCQMHSRQQAPARSGAPLVHTTHLQSGSVVDSGEYVLGQPFEGPALLFPRVGLVTPSKLCELPGSKRVVLSDCILAVRCSSESDVRSLRQLVLASWPRFASGYRGTGAPYITVQRASLILSELLGTAAGKGYMTSDAEALA